MTCEERITLALKWLAAGEPEASRILLKTVVAKPQELGSWQSGSLQSASDELPAQKLREAVRPHFQDLPAYYPLRLRLDLDAADLLASMQTCREWGAADPGALFPRAELLRLSLFAEDRSLETYAEDVGIWAARSFPAGLSRFRCNAHPPSSKLKIAYVSQTFSKLPRASLIDPVLRLHDLSRFEVYCYSTGDASTPPKAEGVLFRQASGLAAPALRALLISDGIDVAVNIDGLMDLDSLGAFALGCAPCQLALPNYFASTGLSCFQSRLAHPELEPAGSSRALYTEPLHEMRIAPYTYTPPRRSPALSPPPRLRKPTPATGRTIGCFNHALKWTPSYFALLSGLLQEDPKIRLLLHCPGLEANLERIFRANFGDRPEIQARVRCVTSLCHWDHLDLHNQVDFLLDTYPLHGATTTLESLWMGKPVLTLAGAGIRSNFSAFAMREIGLTDFIARTPAEFAALALRFAREGVIPSPAEVRDRFAASCFMDYKGWVRGLEGWYTESFQQSQELVACR